MILWECVEGDGKMIDVTHTHTHAHSTGYFYCSGRHLHDSSKADLPDVFLRGDDDVTMPEVT